MKEIQIQTCKLYKIKFEEVYLNTYIAISKNVKDPNVEPLNGLRHPITKENKVGWYLWAGEELLTDFDFFEKIHLVHLKEFWPEAIKFLGLCSGSRFILDKHGYTDIWIDESLSNID